MTLRLPAYGIASLFSVGLLAWATAEGLGLDIIALSVLLSIPILTARTRWAATVALGPVLLYPVAGLNDPTLLHGALNVKPVMAVYLLATVAWIHGARARVTGLSKATLVGMLVILVSGLLESAHAGNGTLGPTITLGIFWLSALSLGSLLADDLSQFTTIGLCALPLAALSLWQAATGKNPYQDLVGPLHFAGSVDYGGLQRATSTFGEPLVAGASLAVLAFLAIAGHRRAALFASLVVLLGAIATVSRSALIGAILGFAVLSAQRTARRRMIVVLVLIVGSVFVAALAVPRFATSLEGRVLNQPYAQVARTAGPQRLATDFSTDPSSLAFGGGIGSTSRELAKQGGVGGVDTYDNEYIDSIFDIGFIPFFLALTLLGYAAFTAMPQRRQVFLPPVVVAVGTLAFFDGLGWPSFGVLFWFIFGALTARDRDNESLDHPT